MLGEKALRLGNNGRRLVRSAIAKALLEKPELRERCRQVSTVKSATVKQLLRMCEIVGEREVAEDAIRQMDPTIELGCFVVIIVSRLAAVTGSRQRRRALYTRLPRGFRGVRYSSSQVTDTRFRRLIFTSGSVK
mmetsp:Transcript_24984/g.21325  ORF Transcript_24984/g.21325 Transcript_24984/m.21325 type:complete len:134 (+) Transcript_24984:168-569(+)